MFAVIRTGGKQYRVSEGSTLVVEKLSGAVGEEIHFDEVLLVASPSPRDLMKQSPSDPAASSTSTTSNESTNETAARSSHKVTEAHKVTETHGVTEDASASRHKAIDADFVDGSGSFRLGRPFVVGAKVTGVIEEQGKLAKLIVFKMRRRKGYRRKRGHRQPYTQIRINTIQVQ